MLCPSWSICQFIRRSFRCRPSRVGHLKVLAPPLGADQHLELLLPAERERLAGFEVVVATAATVAVDRCAAQCRDLDRRVAPPGTAPRRRSARRSRRRVPPSPCGATIIARIPRNKAFGLYSNSWSGTQLHRRGERGEEIEDDAHLQPCRARRRGRSAGPCRNRGAVSAFSRATSNASGSSNCVGSCAADGEAHHDLAAGRDRDAADHRVDLGDTAVVRAPARRNAGSPRPRSGSATDRRSRPATARGW